MAKEIFNPWEVSGSIDYKKLMEQFGIHPLRLLPDIFQKNILFRRGIIFAHRDIQRILESIKNKKPFVMMTGLMPTGKFHIGHMILAQQFIFYQKLGAKIYIAVADLEAYNARNQPLEKSKEIAINEYISNYIALGLDPKKCEIYFQSNRSENSKKSNAYYRLQNLLARHATFSEFRAVYGEITPGKMLSSLLQASDMLHPQLKEFLPAQYKQKNKGIPTIVPVGIDQDPHLRLARDISKRINNYQKENFIQLSSTYHLFMPGLSGGKMSSSDPNSFIALTDSPEEIKNKINKYAFSGGQDTLEEHRKKGGNPDIDVSFQYLKFFFEHSDEKLKQIEEDYRSGKLTTGELKKYTINKIQSFLKKHQEKLPKARKEAEKMFNNQS